MERLTTILKGVDVITSVPFDVPVQSICSDSRHVWPGSIFVAVPGTVQDGTHYIPEAVHRGAAVIISDGHEESHLITQQSRTAVIRVQDPRRALSRMAANFYEHPSRYMTVIGITGTNGKTTTGHLLLSILEACDLKTGLIGTLGITAPGLEANSTLTTPDIIDLHKTLKLFLDGGITHVVMEVSSHALALNRVVDVEFDVAVFTNLSHDHLDFHKTMGDYFKAKARLFSLLPSGGTAILNASDERYEALKALTKAQVVSYSLDGGFNSAFQNWGMTSNGITGTILIGSKTINVHSPLLGFHNLENILSAVTTAWSLGIPDEMIERGIEACEWIPGRMERFTTKNGSTVIIDYAHTPDAYHKLFLSLKSILSKKGRLWVIFGCGGDRDHEKRPLMASMVEQYADKVLVTPDNPRTESLETIYADIEAGFKKNHTFYTDRSQAIHETIAKLRPGDILAIVGKGRENCQLVGKRRIPYSDYETVKKAISKGSSGDAN